MRRAGLSSSGLPGCHPNNVCCPISDPPDISQQLVSYCQLKIHPFRYLYIIYRHGRFWVFIIAGPAWCRSFAHLLGPVRCHCEPQYSVDGLVSDTKWSWGVVGVNEQKLCCSMALVAFCTFYVFPLQPKLASFCSPMFPKFCANKPFLQTHNSIFTGTGLRRTIQIGKLAKNSGLFRHLL